MAQDNLSKAKGADIFSRSKIITGALFSLASLIMVKGVNLIRTIILARLLTPSDFGIFSLLFSFYYFALNTAIFGFPTTAAKFIPLAERENSLDKFLTTLYWIAFFFSLIIGVGVLNIASGIALEIYQIASLLLPIKLIGGAIIFQSLFALNLATLQGLGQFKSRSAIEMIDAFLGLSLVVILVSRYQIIGIAWALLLSGFLSFILSSSIIVKRVSLKKVSKFSLNKAVFNQILRFSSPIFLTTVSIYFFYWIGDILLKNLVVQLEQVGWMYIARSIGQIILFIPAAISIPYLPSISTHLDDPSANVRSFTRISWFLSFIVGIAVGLSVKILVPLLYGTEYSKAGESIFLYSLASIPMAMTTLTYSTIFIGRGYVWPLLFLTLLWGCIFVTLAYFLLQMTGINGIMIAYLFSYGLFLAAASYYLHNQNILLGISLSYIVYVFVSAFIALLLQQLPFGGVYIATSVLLISSVICVGFFLLDTKSREMIMNVLKYDFKDRILHLRR